MTTLDIMKAAKKASKFVASVTTEQKNNALLAMADSIEAATEEILLYNKMDIEASKGIISDVMLDRLELNEERIKSMADGIRHVVTLDDPVGRCISSYVRGDGLTINKMSVAIGVVAIIYESRPNVTSDAAALSLKSGNACVLRCGKEAHRSAQAITNAIRRGLSVAGFPEDCVVLVEDTSRESARELMTGNGYIDLLIPRGGPGLIRACVENATVACIETGTGICHVYIDKDADVEMAVKIVNNAKTSRPSVCNAAEVCVIHKDILKTALPLLEQTLVVERKQKGLPSVLLKMDSEALSISEYGVPLADGDFDTEFLDYVMAVKTVSSLEEAVEHISEHSTGHSESIISTDNDAIDYFVKNIDSAAVYVNASTRFTDGGEFGLGCEMGISTQKLHARGPMGLNELTTYKYVINGNGNIR